ncbi:putative hydrolase of the HAD superfamily [Paenibacillus sp. DS2015]|uniref:HAD family hydrolase n=1 Tax=Paenibacillus sp. DS2015 TaxID=3373917 RepID=UPI003D1AF5FE
MYKAIIFDLDNTLINYNLCELESMRHTCKEHNLFVDDITQWEIFRKSYEEHNFRHWMDFVNGGDIKTIHEVLNFSFRDSLSGAEQIHNQLSETYWRYFCNSCYFEDGAEQLLTNIKDKYPLGIITNGISEAQRKRLIAGNIHNSFQSLVISDEVGIRKPQVEIFEIALNELQVRPNEVLFVGDSLQDDYQGSMNAEIDFCYYNPQNIEVPAQIQPKYMIQHLLELIDENVI